MTNKTIYGKCTCEHSFSTNFLATSCEVFTWIGLLGETYVGQFPNYPKNINLTSCSSTPRLHLVYGATWGEGKYNPSLKTIFFWSDNVFLLSTTNLDRRSQTPKRLRYVTSIILGMNTDAARNRLLKKREPVFMV